MASLQYTVLLAACSALNGSSSTIKLPLLALGGDAFLENDVDAEVAGVEEN